MMVPSDGREFNRCALVRAVLTEWWPVLDAVDSHPAPVIQYIG